MVALTVFFVQRFGVEGHAVWILLLPIGLFAIVGLPIAQDRATRLTRLQVVEDTTWLVFPLTEAPEKGDRAAFPLSEHGGTGEDQFTLAASGGATDQELRQDTPVWCILASVGLALLAGMLIFLGSLKVPPRDSLQSLSGNVINAHRSCSRNAGCWVTMNLRTSLGEIEVSQDDFTAPGLPIVRDGVSIGVLVSPPPGKRWFWELRSGNRLLISYDEVATGILSHRRKLSAFGYLAATIAIVSLVVGIRLGIQRGTWRQGRSTNQ